MRGRMLVAALVIGGAFGLARADDKTLDRTELDKRISSAVYESASAGTDIFNKGGYAECARLYQGTLMAVVPLLDHRPKVQTDAKTRLERAKGMAARPADMAFELRTALDEIQNAIAPPKKDTGTMPKGTGPKDTMPKDTMPKDTMPKDTMPKDAKDPTAKKPLWDRLGGEGAVKAVVHDFVLAAAEDPKVNFFRDGKYKLDAKGVEKLERMTVELISEVTGGPLKYSGRSMKESHKGMGITDDEFNALAGHLVATLKKYRVSQPEIDELVKIVADTHDDIVEKKK